MGDRAVITTRENYENNGVGIYVHWCGTRKYIEGFLKYCSLRGFRSVEEDEPYAWARLCQVIANFFGGELSVGIGQVDHMDSCDWDNGTYLIEGWDIVGRVNAPDDEEAPWTDVLIAIVQKIDRHQLPSEQLGAEKIYEMLEDFE